TFSGGAILSAGIVILPTGTTSSSGAVVSGPLGKGPLVLNGATLIANTSVTLATPTLITASSTIGGESAITFAGTTTLLSAPILTVTDTAGATITGNITE